MSKRADVVVVGGGILGCAAALHLADAGAGDVLLLERDDVAQATSAAGAGFIGEWAAGYLTPWGSDELAIERYALAFYAGLAEDGFDIGYKRNGNLWAATTDEAWDKFVKVIAEHPAVEDKQILSGADVEAATGIIRGDTVVGGVLHPRGGQVTAPKATRAVATRFERAGGRIATRRPVDAVMVSNGRVVGVETRHGRVDTDTVVLAAGPWTRSLLAPLGVRVPMVPLVAARIVTEPLGVPAPMPTLMLQEFSFIWLREEQGGLLWGCSFEIAPRHAFVDREVPERLDQLPLDGVLYTQRAGVRASEVMPVLARYHSMTVAHGAPSYTPDLKGMVGAVPAIEGLYVVGGCNEAGISHGPGYGKAIAELIVDGTPKLVGLDAYRLDRFGDTFANDAAVVTAMDDTSGNIFQAA